MTVWSTQFRQKAPSCRQTTVLGSWTICSLLQCCQAASPMVWIPASTSCLTSLVCVKAWDNTRPARMGGTRMALARIFSCPLCSAWLKDCRTTRLKRLQFVRVSQMGFARISPVSLCAKTSLLPKVLCPPMVGSCSRTAVSNSSNRSNSCRSMTTCTSSPERVVNSSCNTNWR